MDELGLHPFIRVKRKNLRLVQENAEKIQDLFSVRVSEKTVAKQNVSKCGFVLLSVEHVANEENSLSVINDVIAQLQRYVDNLCSWERDGDDSSYDSDYEDSGVASHHDVSRTVSDTLGAEFAEYVSERPNLGTLGAKYVPGGALGAEYLSERPIIGTEYVLERLTPPAEQAIDRPAGYTARVEFGLKLGYTEKLVQAALQKLGPDPGQNELLEELVKLGAQAPRLQDPTASDEVPERPYEDTPPCVPLRPVVIDGSNVAMSHGNKEVFSCRGIKICVDWFRSRGHREITVFVPKWRKEAPRPDNPITDQDIMTELERDRHLVFTPSRLVGGKRMVCYDDRYILQLAADNEGIVVSNDNYRDLVQEKPEFRKVVEERILMYSFVNDRFMPPDDPLGRSGPTLDNFLHMGSKRGDAPPPCPYAKKCTYGNKCKFHHPERTTPLKSVTDRLLENAQRQLQARSNPAQKSVSLPLPADPEPVRKQPLTRTKSTAPTFTGGDELRDKSRSVENVAGCFRTPPPGYATAWPRTPDQPGGSWVTPSFEAPPAPDNNCTNMHRKLQRQLTLNPSCDPRLHRYMQQHRPVARHASDSAQTPWERQHAHPSVTRIASAPPPHTSDPQLWPPQLCWPPPPLQFTPSSEDVRRRLHYHLASIFPEEQVLQAMQQWPDETNPQKICAAILSMFPKT